MCFYRTQSDILLCGIARFSRGNKNKLRSFQLQKGRKLRTTSLKQNLLVLIKKECIYPRLAMNKRQILQRQGKLCICFIFNLKRLSDSEFLVSKEMFCQI